MFAEKKEGFVEPTVIIFKVAVSFFCIAGFAVAVFRDWGLSLVKRGKGFFGGEGFWRESWGSRGTCTKPQWVVG